MIEILILAALVVAVLFGFVLMFGAPYLPTLSPQIKTALDLVDLQPGQHLIELGCGDGKVLIDAAERGARVTGYELNPLLAFIAWARTRRFKNNVKVVWGNFWRRRLPLTDVVFVFLLPKYMPKLDKKITQEYSGSNVKLVSIAFKIQYKKPKKIENGVFLYEYK